MPEYLCPLRDSYVRPPPFRFILLLLPITTITTTTATSAPAHGTYLVDYLHLHYGEEHRAWPPLIPLLEVQLVPRRRVGRPQGGARV